jgi:NADH-quinone oxidoreductase subunit H
MITVSFLTAILFFGGWDLPFVTSAESAGFVAGLVKVTVLIVKVFALILFMMWLRWTLPRFRFDQLMSLAWKVLIPLALANLLFTAIVVQLGRSFPETVKPLLKTGLAAFWIAAGVLVVAGMWYRSTQSARWARSETNG